MPNLTRRDFIRLAGLAGLSAALPAAACAPDEAAPAPGSAAPPAGAAYMAVVRGPDPEAITRAAVEAVGGMGRFVAKGDDVICKPNICVNYSTYEYAATTNPTVVGTLVRMALEAGAKRVRVMDTPYTSDPENIEQVYLEISFEQ